MKKIHFIICFSFIAITSLHAQVKGKITMVYQETVCPPQWISYDQNNQTLHNLQQLLKKDSVKVYSLKFTGNLYEQTCAGCQCLTGRNIEITIDAKDQAKVEKMRFYKPWVWMNKYELVCDWTMDLNHDQIADQLREKNLRIQGLYCTGLSEKKTDLCSTQSGRMITIRIDQEDVSKAKLEGFIVNKDFKQY